MSPAFNSADPLDLLWAQLRQLGHSLWMGAAAFSANRATQTVETQLRFRPEMGGKGGEFLFQGGIVASLIDMTGHSASRSGMAAARHRRLAYRTSISPMPLTSA